MLEEENNKRKKQNKTIRNMIYIFKTYTNCPSALHPKVKTFPFSVNRQV